VRWLWRLLPRVPSYQLHDAQQKTYVRVCTVIHRKALEKTLLPKTENGVARKNVCYEVFLWRIGRCYPICRMRTRCAMIAIVFHLFGRLSVAPLYGQAIYGSIYGQVTDQTGAVVPNATIHP